MESVFVIICALAAGWGFWKTGWAVAKLREQRRRASGGDGGHDGSTGIGSFVAGTTSGDGGHHGDCGGHGHGGDGGGHGGW